MDPITHALVGTGVAALGGQAYAFGSPIFWGAVLGSVAPDIDIAYQTRGHAVYLKHHRGFSHSIPGLFVLAALITGLLAVIFPGMSIVQVFLWTFMGAFSHTLLDILNSYGAQLLKKRVSLNILQIFDPIVVILFVGLFIGRSTPVLTASIILMLTVAYFLFRYYMRKAVERTLWDKYSITNPERIIVMPAMLGINNWDFVVETDSKYILGQAKYLDNSIKIRNKLKKHKINNMIEKALESKMGQYFKKFTPYYHVTHSQEDDKHIIRFFDLRYHFKKDFLHSATVVLDEKSELMEAFFHPYRKETKVRV